MQRVLAKPCLSVSIRHPVCRWAAIALLQQRVEASDAPLTNAAIERLWLATRDLLQAEQPNEAQEAALSFVCALLHAPREPLSDPNRTFIFGVIRGHENAAHVRSAAHALYFVK